GHRDPGTRYHPDVPVGDPGVRRRPGAGASGAPAPGRGDGVSVALAPATARRTARALLELTKPRIASLVVLTGVPALLMAANGLPAPRIFFGAIVGTVLAAGSAACF